MSNCGAVNNSNSHTGLRIGAIFILLATSLFGTLFPVVTKRVWKIPVVAFDFVKYFGSGVIIATAFIHLLAPAFAELGSQCVTGTWQDYPFASAFAMASVFGLFFAELFAFRLGSSILARMGMSYGEFFDGSSDSCVTVRRIWSFLTPLDIHAGPISHSHVQSGRDHSHAGATSIEVQQNPSATEKPQEGSRNESSIEDLSAPVESNSDVLAQLVGVAILEFGVIFHSIIIGLTLAVNEDFKTLFVVIVFHQMFEGLGLGSRLAYLALPKSYNWVPYIGGITYSIATPIGTAIGLGVRSTYNPDSMKASLITGTLDSISAGILLYTGLVEVRLPCSRCENVMEIRFESSAIGSRVLVQPADAQRPYR
ncbi:Zinc/iron permease [Cantharellus anzutake]|uniref:Zinc/iron permease n=1 Tax=Cantharellus anzutake TaxID=1750568 RepID=UPI001904B2B8|nr:Zinc/iron permease [Cantharellus anzutake]KAF8327213.1 Zinc/iron permease [Cantharellus anzutake]